MASSDNPDTPMSIHDLTPEELAKYKKKFQAFDIEKDGILTVREMATACRVIGYKLSREELLDIFGAQNIKEGGGLNFEEFVAAMLRKSGKKPQVPLLREKFKIYDRHKRGYIGTDDAHFILQKELGFCENKTEEFLLKFDMNGDYVLSLPEFVPFQTKVEELKVQIKQAFTEFDRNQDGYVDLEELRAVMIPKGFSEKKVREFLVKYDEDQDGRLDYPEFAAFWNIPI